MTGWEPLVAASRYTDRSEVHIEALHAEEKDVDYLLVLLDSAYVEVRDELLRRNQRGRNE